MRVADECYAVTTAACRPGGVGKKEFPVLGTNFCRFPSDQGTGLTSANWCVDRLLAGENRLADYGHQPTPMAVSSAAGRVAFLAMGQALKITQMPRKAPGRRHGAWTDLVLEAPKPHPSGGS